VIIVREASSQTGELSSPSVSGHPPWQSGYWWRRRHFHVPVIVWIVASVLGGAAIGNVLDSKGTTDSPPATVADVVEPAAAFTCDENYASCVPVATDVDCVVADVEGRAEFDSDVESDVDGPVYRAEPVEVVGNDVYDLDADHDGIGCD
jgi:hypothetical protein